MSLLRLESAIEEPPDKRKQEIETRLAANAPGDAVPVVHRSENPRAVWSQLHRNVLIEIVFPSALGSALGECKPGLAHRVTVNH